MIEETIEILLKKKISFSDLLIKEGTSIWVRISGSLQKTSSAKVTREDILKFLQRHEASTAIKTQKLDIDMKETGDLDFALRVGGRGFRGNLYYADNKKLAIAMRLQAESVPELESIGVPEAFISCLEQSKGLLLVTGATGSGKTTTLAAGLEYINATRAGHIITLEDPVEYRIESNLCFVDQRQIKRDATNFGAGLRAALRQDPDVILVGELRDYDTVKTALDAANTGHLVMGTLHTNSARQTIERITSFFGQDRQEWALQTLSQVIVGIASQVLVPKANGQGRAMAAELMVGTPEIKACIRENRTAQLFNTMDTGAKQGHVLMNRRLRQLVLDGTITPEAALYYSYDPNDMKKELRDVL